MRRKFPDYNPNSSPRLLCSLLDQWYNLCTIIFQIRLDAVLYHTRRMLLLVLTIGRYQQYNSNNSQHLSCLLLGQPYSLYTIVFRNYLDAALLHRHHSLLLLFWVLCFQDCNRGTPFSLPVIGTALFHTRYSRRRLCPT